MSTASAAPAPRRVPLLPILSVHFIGTLGFSIVLPFLVFLVTRWGGNAVVYGVVGATYSAFQLIGAPILGRWSDVHGRRRILLLSQAGTLLSWVVFVAAFLVPEQALLDVTSGPLGSFTITIPLLIVFLSRALDGLTGGNISVASAYLADVTPEAERSRNFGKLAVSGNLGFVIGPAVAGVLGATVLGEFLPVLAALAISAVATWVIAFRLPESNPCAWSGHARPDDVRKTYGQEPKDCFEGRDAKPIRTRELLRLPKLPVLLVIYFLVMLAFNFFYVSFPMHAATELRWTVMQTGIFFSVLSITMSLVQGPGLRWATRHWNDRALAGIGATILAASFVLFAVPRFETIYSGAILLAVGNGLLWPSVLAILSRVGERHQGAIQGLAGSLGSVASILGLIVGGLFYEALRDAVFFIPAGLVALTLVLSARLPGAPAQDPAAS